jgi:hypothetical protein
MKRNGQSKIDSDDRASVIYHVVYSHERFDESAQALFKLVQRCQQVRPGTARKLFLDIEGHRNSEGGFDADMLELQQDFLLGFLARFLAEIHCPLFQVTNPKPQENDIPEELIIKLPTRG